MYNVKEPKHGEPAKSLHLILILLYLMIMTSIDSTAFGRGNWYYCCRSLRRAID